MCNDAYAVFQFTLNDYDVERIKPNVPPVAERVETFRRLSNRLGRDRVVWHFNPLILTDKLGVKDLMEKVKRLGDQIAPFASRLVFSFIDIAAYKKVAANMSRGEIAAREFSSDEMEEMSAGIGALVKGWGIAAGTCGEIKDFDRYGIEHNRCIDDRLMVKCFSHDKDPGQRLACGCIMSKDIGEYNTGSHLCKYCYANFSDELVLKNYRQFFSKDDIISARRKGRRTTTMVFRCVMTGRMSVSAIFKNGSAKMKSGSAKIRIGTDTGNEGRGGTSPKAVNLRIAAVGWKGEAVSPESEAVNFGWCPCEQIRVGASVLRRDSQPRRVEPPVPVRQVGRAPCS